MHSFVICIDNTEYQASLEPRKLYEVLPDATAAQRNYIRVIDESGEAYLYPNQLFIELPLAEEMAEKVSKIA